MFPPSSPDDLSGATLAPGPWEGRGIGLDIPPDFVGIPGPEGSALVLTLLHEATKARLELWVYPKTTAMVAPRPRIGCEPFFTDVLGSPRTVAGLDVEQTTACLYAEGPDGLVHGWYGWLAGQEVHLEAVYPDGDGVAGRLRVQPVLGSLRAAP